MSNTLISYITELNTNPALLAQHQENMEQSAANYGLTINEMDILKNEALTKEYIEMKPTEVKGIFVMTGLLTKH